MNTRIIIPSVTLVVGLGAGSILTKTLSSPQSSTDEQTVHSTKSTNNSSQAKGTNKDSNNGKELPQSANTHTQSLQEIINLLSPHYNSPPSPEFYRSIQSLSIKVTSHYLTQLESSFRQDPRYSKVRSALLRHWAAQDSQGALAKIETFKNATVRSSSMNEVFQVIAETDPAQAKLMVLEMKEGIQRTQLIQVVARTLALVDPQGAMHLLEETQTRSPYAYQRIFSAWAEKAPSAAIAALNNIADPDSHKLAFKGIARSLASEDPERAWEFAQSATGKKQRDSALAEITSQLAQRDPDQALSLINSLEKGSTYETVLEKFSTSWMGADPEAALSWIESLPAEQKQHAVGRHSSLFTHHEPNRIVKLLDSLPSNSETAHLYSSLAQNWSKADPEASLAWVKQLPTGKNRVDAMESLISSLAENDPQKAATLLEEEPLNQASRYQYRRLVSTWAQRDPEAAFSWIKSMQLPENIYSSVVSNAISRMAQDTPEKAAEYTLQLTDNAARKEATEDLLGRWASEDLEHAKSWALNNLEEEEQSSAYKTIISSISYEKPLVAKELLEEISTGLSPEEIQKEFGTSYARVAGNWAQNEPNKAAEWALSLHSLESQEKGIANVIDEWADYDSTGAANFILTLDEGSIRDNATESLVHDLRRTDPESAFLWADSMSNEKERDSLVRRAIESWKENDSEAALQALDDANISQKARETILKTFDEDN